METYSGIQHHDLLKLIVMLAVLLGTARLLGELMRRIGQPVIVGELLAGVVVGPAMLSKLVPAAGEWLVPENAIQWQLLDAVGTIGIILLILVVGLETDLALIRARARQALSIGVMGFVVPFVSALALARVFPDSLLGPAASRASFGLILAVALALSAIPVLAKILSDLRLLRAPFGQTALAAGIFDDIIGWTALGLVTALATVGNVSAGTALRTIAVLAGFFAVSYIVARPLAHIGVRLIQERTRMRDGLLSFLVFFAFGWGAFSHALHLEPVLGAFVAGVIMSREHRLPDRVIRQLESMTMGVFAPLFLATAGLRLQADFLFRSETLWLTIALIAVASAGKLGGGYVGAWMAGIRDRRHAIGYGVALNARGVLGIVVAVLGRNAGLFGDEVYGMVVITSILTSLTAPVALKFVLRHELATDDADHRDPYIDYRRVLLPVRVRPAEDNAQLRTFEAKVLENVVKAPRAVTLMTVLEDGVAPRRGREFLGQILNDLPSGSEIHRRIGRGDTASEILREADGGYDLIMLGASERNAGADRLFEPAVDDIVRMAPCDTMILSAAGGTWPPRSILVPISGSVAAGRAARLAFMLAGGADVTLLHVVDPELSLLPGAQRDWLPNSMVLGQSLMNDLLDEGTAAGANVSTELVTGPGVVSAILDRAERGVDLIVLGTELKAGSTRLFLGPRVERLVMDAPCPLILLNHAADATRNRR